MNIPIFDIKKQIQGIRSELDQTIGKVLDSGNFVQGQFVEQFEQDFAQRIGARYAVACNSGTSALQLAIEASGVKPGDEVIIPGMTFIATASAVINAGAVPVVVDVENKNWLIDPRVVEAAITNKTSAVMPVHLHGRMADLSALQKICSKYGLLLIEDSAQAHLATQHDKFAGSIGDAAGFSFYPGKNLGACGEGGVLTTNSSEVALKARLLRDWGTTKKYHHELFGYNFRMDEIQGAILSTKLKYLESWTSARESVFLTYSQSLLGSPFWLPTLSSVGRDVHHVISTLVENRDEVLKKFAERSISAGCHYPKGIHEHKALIGRIRSFGSLKNVEFFANCNLSLPIFPELTESEVTFVSDSLIQFAKPIRP